MGRLTGAESWGEEVRSARPCCPAEARAVRAGRGPFQAPIAVLRWNKQGGCPGQAHAFQCNYGARRIAPKLDISDSCGILSAGFTIPVVGNSACITAACVAQAAAQGRMAIKKAPGTNGSQGGRGLHLFPGAIGRLGSNASARRPPPVRGIRPAVVDSKRPSTSMSTDSAPRSQGFRPADPTTWIVVRMAWRRLIRFNHANVCQACRGAASRWCFGEGPLGMAGMTVDPAGTLPCVRHFYVAKVNRTTGSVLGPASWRRDDVGVRAARCPTRAALPRIIPLARREDMEIDRQGQGRFLTGARTILPWFCTPPWSR